MKKFLSFLFPVLAVFLLVSGFRKSDMSPDWPGDFHFCGTNRTVTAVLSFKIVSRSTGLERIITRNCRVELPARILFKHETSGKIYIFDLREIGAMEVSFKSYYFGWAGKGVGDDVEKARAFAVHMGYKAKQLDLLSLRLRDGTELSSDRASGLNYILLTDPREKLYGDTFWEKMKDLNEANYWQVKSVVNWVNTWPLFPWAAGFLKACGFELKGKYSETKVDISELIRIEL